MNICMAGDTFTLQISVILILIEAHTGNNEDLDPFGVNFAGDGLPGFARSSQLSLLYKFSANKCLLDLF